jgi:hypothetical protein
MIDMSDLEELDGVTLDLPDEAPDDIAAAVPAWERPTEILPPPTLDRGRDVSEVPSEDKEATDDLLEAELELALDTEETAPAPPATSRPEPEVGLELDLEDLELDDDENIGPSKRT